MIKIAIDDRLKQDHANEVYWTLRLLLSCSGYSWQEMPANANNLDIYYGCDSNAIGRCKIYLKADFAQWQDKVNKKLTQVAKTSDCYVIDYGCNTDDENFIVNTSSTLIINKDLIFDLFWLVSGLSEKSLQAGKHGHYNFNNTIYDQQKVFNKALGSDIGTFLGELFKTYLPYTPIQRWPHNKQAAATFSHDCDYPEVIRWLEPLRIIKRNGFKSFPHAIETALGQRHHWHFMSWCEIEKQYGIQSAFYFVARQGSLIEYATGLPDPFYDITSEKFKKLFEQLNEQGMEIGLHASYLAHSSNEKFKAEKCLLEEMANVTIVGNRHHYWHLSEKNPEDTLLQHEKLGFLYDATLAHDSYIGWRRHCNWPYFPYHHDQRVEIKTLQIPTAFMDEQLFKLSHINGSDPQQAASDLMHKVINHQGVFMISFHDYIYDAALYPGIAQLYRDCCEMVVNNNAFWIATPSELAEYWLWREKVIKAESSGLNP